MTTLQEELITELINNFYKENINNAFTNIDTTGQTVQPQNTFNWTVNDMIGIYNNPNTDSEMKKIIENRLSQRGTYKEDISKYVPGQFESYETMILQEDMDSPSYNVKIRFNPLDDAMVTYRRASVYDEDGDYDAYGIASNTVKSKKRKTYRGSILNKQGDDTGYSIVGDIGKETRGLDHPAEHINVNPSSDYGIDTGKSAKDIYNASIFKPKHNSRPTNQAKRGFEVTTPNGEVVYIDRKDLETFLTNIGAL